MILAWLWKHIFTPELFIVLALAALTAGVVLRIIGRVLIADIAFLLAFGFAAGVIYAWGASGQREIDEPILEAKEKELADMTSAAQALGDTLTKQNAAIKVQAERSRKARLAAEQVIQNYEAAMRAYGAEVEALAKIASGPKAASFEEACREADAILARAARDAHADELRVDAPAASAEGGIQPGQRGVRAEGAHSQAPADADAGR